MVWFCGACTFENKSFEKLKCEMCDSPCPEDQKPQKASFQPAQLPKSVKPRIPTTTITLQDQPDLDDEEWEEGQAVAGDAQDVDWGEEEDEDLDWGDEAKGDDTAAVTSSPSMLTQLVRAPSLFGIIDDLPFWFSFQITLMSFAFFRFQYLV